MVKVEARHPTGRPGSGPSAGSWVLFRDNFLPPLSTNVLAPFFLYPAHSEVSVVDALNV